MSINFRKAIKNLQFKTPLRKYLFHRYDYFFHPAELCFLCNCVQQTADVKGNLLEVGCAQGSTTVFLNRHRQWLESQGQFPADKTYYCIDTFAGFTERDIAFEKTNRGKENEEYDQFRVNDVRWSRAMLHYNQIDRVQAIEADAGEFEYSKLAPVSFALLDVDFYLPILHALRSCFPLLSDGGVLIVDDCKPNQKWDGAYQAYQEFREEMCLEEEIHFGKFGMIRK